MNKKMNNINFIKSSLVLHNAVPVSEKKLYNRNLIRYGYIAPNNLSEIAEKILIEDAIHLNKSFYKSWNDIITKTREELAIDQIFYYISVSFAISDLFQDLFLEIDQNYINADIDVNQERRSIPLRFIKGLTVDEIKNLTASLLYKKIALKESTIDDVFNIIDIDDVELPKIQNRDSRTYISVKYNIKPQYPLEIFRCMLYDITDQLNIIKNREFYDKMKSGWRHDCAEKWLKGNEEKFATIFNRYKPIFMSMKNHDDAKPYINKISKLSKKHHVPYQSVRNEPITGFEIVRHLKYLIQNKQPKVYQIRNGKMWCTRDRKDEIDKFTRKLKAILPNTFIQSQGTRIALPTSEKNFIGPFPIGTVFGMHPDTPTSNSLIIGIHWRNQDGHSIDLDLSAVDLKGKIGWDSDYYTHEKDVIFSGDIVDAPNGANEYLYFKNVKTAKAVLLNKFNTSHEGNVNVDIIIARAENSPSENDIINDENIIATISTVCDERQRTLGIVYPTHDGPRFVLIDKCVGNKLTRSDANQDSNIMIETFMDNYIYMDEYITSIPVSKNTIDLTNKIISKSTMLDIFKNNPV
jgi:hypothetical protein